MRILALLFLAGLASGVSAEESPDAILVTASRVPLSLIAAGSSVSVIDREQIDARQSIFAVDLLKDVPGIAVSRSGSIGAQTQLRMRGAEANQVLVLIDGIEANDPAGNDEFGFQDLTLWDVERIEVVRGPQSALWGSDALAGVINVITRRPTETFEIEGFGEGGAFDSYAAGARAAGKVGDARMGFSVSGIDSDGSNASRQGSEDDGYDNTTASLTLAGDPRENLNLEFVGRYTDARKEFDGTDFIVTGLPTDTADETDISLGYFRAGGSLALLNGRWKQSLSAALTTTDTENTNEFGDNGSQEAQKYGVYYQTTWQFAQETPSSPGNSVTLALDHEQQDFSQRGPASPFGDPNQDQDLDNNAAVLEFVLSPWERTAVSLSGRYDDNSDFDDVGTFRVTTSRVMAERRTRLHASYGTGQKAPTFIERYGFFPDQFAGNPELKPEESKGWDLGVEQPMANDRLSVGLTYFHEDLENEINGFVFDPDSSLFTAVNLPGDSQRRGVEASFRALVTEGIKVTGTYTYTDASQPDALTGEDVREIRRPRHSASLNADWEFLDGSADVNVNLSHTGQQDDNFFEVAPPFGVQVVDLDAYTLASIAAGYQLTPQVRLYTRVDNLFDEQYEDVYGYNTPGIGAYAGLRLTF